MRVIFAGTPELAKTVLANLLTYGIKVCLVLTKEDSIANRGKKLTPSPVKLLALEHSIEVMQIKTFKNNDEAFIKLRSINADLMIVAAYGLILPQSVLDIPKFGCINIHVSLLPHLRGAAPIARAVLGGDTVTGVTIMQMDKGMDTGNILLQQSIDIDVKETAKSLHDKLAILGANAIIEYLKNKDNITPIAQNVIGVSYANKIEKHEGLINWSDSPIIIERKIRGFNPFPICFSYLQDVLIKIWQAHIITLNDAINNNLINYSVDQIKELASGTIIAINKEALIVKCNNGDYLLAITEVQLANRNRQNIAQFMNNKQYELQQFTNQPF